MKIIQFIYTLGQGGAERFVVNLSNELACAGNEVIILTLRSFCGDAQFYFNQIDAAVKVTSLNISEGFSLGKVLQVEHTIKEISPDVVHCHLNVIPYIFRMSLSTKIRFFHTLHSIAEKALGVKVQKLINNFFYQSKRIIPITISEECKQSFILYYGLKDVSCINNGASAPKASDKFEEVKQEINSYKENNETTVFIHVARFGEPKRQDTLVEVFNQLSKENENFILLILGVNYDSKEGIALQNKSCDRIFYLGLKENVSDYLLNADAFCLTSYFEGLPISLLEALSCGCYPICTPVGGIPDVINSNEVGLLSEDISVESYKKAIKTYLEQKDSIDKARMIEYFNANYTMKQCAEKYIKLFI